MHPLELNQKLKNKSISSTKNENITEEANEKDMARTVDLKNCQAKSSNIELKQSKALYYFD